MITKDKVFDGCVMVLNAIFESVALYSHNGKDGENVDTCLLSSIPVSTVINLF